MSDVEIGAISGGSGSFVTQKFFNGAVATGVNGDILTITAPLGKRVRLDYLASNTVSAQLGTELYVDGVLINQSATRLASVSDASFSAFNVIQGGGGTVGSISDVVGREIIVKKTSGPTTNQIDYAYSEGL